jgi:hypothetical protein
MQSTYSARRAHNGRDGLCSAEVTVRAEPWTGQTQVSLADEVSEVLRQTFGVD